MLHSIETGSSEILALLQSADCNAVKGADITIRKVWCAGGRQIGTGADELGRTIVFSLSLSTGHGIARRI